MPVQRIWGIELLGKGIRGEVIGDKIIKGKSSGSKSSGAKSSGAKSLGASQGMQTWQAWGHAHTLLRVAPP